jgi:hypothetical protein
MDVVFRNDDRGFTGTVQLRDGESTSGQRELHASLCGEVMDGLAVVAAIALRGDSEAPPSNAASAVPASAAASPLPKGVPPTEPVTSQPVPRGTAVERRLQNIGQSGKETTTIGAGELTFDNVLGISASAGMVLGAIPSVVLPRYDLTISRANFVTTPDARDFMTGVVPRLRWTYLGTGTYRTNEFSTQLNGFSAGLSGCRSLVYYIRGPVVMVCGGIAAGAMSIRTRNAEGVTTQSKTMGIASANLDLQTQYNFSSLFHVALTIGGELWVSNITAERPDGSEIFHSSLFNGYAMAGVGIHF